MKKSYYKGTWSKLSFGYMQQELIKQILLEMNPSMYCKDWTHSWTSQPDSEKLMIQKTHILLYCKYTHFIAGTVTIDWIKQTVTKSSGEYDCSSLRIDPNQRWVQLRRNHWNKWDATYFLYVRKKYRIDAYTGREIQISSMTDIEGLERDGIILIKDNK